MSTDLRDELHRCAVRGEWWVPGGDPELPSEWIRELVVTGLVPGNGTRVHDRGIRVRGITPTDHLDLEHAHLAVPLLLDEVQATEPLVLDQAVGGWVGITNSRLNGLHAHQVKLDHSLDLQGTTSSSPMILLGAEISGDVLLTSGFEVQGGAQLGRSTIGGDLGCSGGTFTNKNREALILDGATVGGNVFLGDEFIANGEVRALGVEIGGQLVCSAGTFNNASGDALSLDHARITGDARLDSGFAAHGRVRMVGATIGGQLMCSGGSFGNEGMDALTLDRAVIGGSVRLGKDFVSQGRVRMVGIAIGGQLICSSASFNNEGGDALVADGAKVTADVFLNKNFVSRGCVRLPGAAIGGQLSCVGAHFSNPGAIGLMLQEATIAGAFLWQPGVVELRTGIDLNSCEVDSLVDAIAMWPQQSWLELDGFTYHRFAGDATWDVEKRITWIQLMSGFRSQPYEQLSAVYRAAGRTAAAQSVNIAGEEARNEILSPWQRPWHRLWGALTAYGYKPARALRIFGFLLVVAWVFFWWAGASGVMEPTDLSRSASATACTATYPCYEPLVYAADVMIPVVDLDQRDLWMPDAARSGVTAGSLRWSLGGAAVRWVTVFLTVAGWALTAAFVAALGKTISRP